jgi:hypothetical protein
MYSVAKCTRCNVPLCGHHTTYSIGKVLCPAHVAEVKRQAAAREAEQRKLAEIRDTEMAARTRAVEAKVNAVLPALPHPGNPPYLGSNAEPDAYWFLGLIPYWFGGTLVVALIARSFVIGALISGIVALAVLGYWLLSATEKKSRYQSEKRTHEQQLAAIKGREQEREALRSSLLAEK